MSESPDEVPVVTVIVVSFGTPSRTLDCLRLLRCTKWPDNRLSIVVVDNAADPSLAASICAAWSDGVRYVATDRNLGFGGACNVGISYADLDGYVAFINPDVAVEPDWLAPLVRCADRTGAGAVTPRVQLVGQYTAVVVSAEVSVPGGGDHRRLGVQVSGARLNATDALDGVKVGSGSWGWEHDRILIGGRYFWTSDRCTIYLRGAATGDAVWLRLSNSFGPTSCTISVDGALSRVVVDVAPKWFQVGAVRAPRKLVQTAGLTLRRDGSSRDRLFLSAADATAARTPTEVFAWSGAAVLVRGTFLRDVGGFDERLFLYYEDVDLAWRGRRRGWAYHYEPSAVVSHEQSATVGADSALARHLLQRNRLVVLTKNAPATLAGRAVLGQLGAFTLTARRDLLERAMARKQPITTHVVAAGRVLGGYLRLLPSALTQRYAFSLRSPRRMTLGAWFDDDDAAGT